MHVRCAIIVLVLSAGLLAQSAPPSCPADRPVDDIITEIQKQQSNKKHRNANPLPDAICIFGWCRNHSNQRTPPTLPAPESAPPANTPNGNESSSSINAPVDKCNDAMELALKAAHDVEVGDYSFQVPNYNGALMRYKDAADEKPGDAAIHVRLGRVFEKLNQLPQAIQQYKTAQELAGPAKWTDEARSALHRLQQH